MSVQKSAIYEYDFAVDGGAIGTRDLRLVGGDANPPPGSFIESKNVMLDVLTVPVGATATIGLQLDTAGDVQAAVAISGAPWSTLGLKDPSIEAPLKDPGGGPVQMVTAVAALTAGKFRVYLSYLTTS